MTRLAFAAAVALAIALAGCASTSKYRFENPQGKSADQVKVDTLICKDEANSRPDIAQSGFWSEVLAATIIGAPIAFNMASNADDAWQLAYAACLGKRGYTVVPVKQ